MGAIHSLSLFCKEQWERFAHCRSFVKSDESKLLPSLFKKERLSKERRERFALGYKKGKSSEKLSKTYQNLNCFRANRSFLRVICMNHKGITHVALFYRSTRVIRSRSLFCHEQPEQIAHSRSIKWAIFSERANSQPCQRVNRGLMPRKVNFLCLKIQITWQKTNENQSFEHNSQIREVQ